MVNHKINGRCLVDGKGNPFLVSGDSAWSLIVQLTKEDTEIYFEDRRQKGFSTIVVNLIESKYVDNPPRSVSGNEPFTTPGDFSTPNEAYFAHVDWVVSKAAEKGITLFLNPAYMGSQGQTVDTPTDGWWLEIKANGPGKCRNYGKMLGDRYKQYSNIIWVAGGDRTPPSGGEGEQNALEILLGIRENAPNHLWTAHWGNDIDSLDVAAFSAYMDLNGVYAYQTPPPGSGSSFRGTGFVHERMLRAYNRADFKPIFLWESWYEGLTWGGWTTPPEMVRRQAYEASFSGSTGQNFGSYYIWSFGGPTDGGRTPDWKMYLNSQSTNDMVRLKEFLGNRAWYDLVPDQDHRLVTNGHGTFGEYSFLTAAYTPNGCLGVAYLPSTGTGTRTLTVDMSQFSGSVTAKWYNPTNGAYTTISGLPFENSGTRTFVSPGDNGMETNDWVLVLEK